MANIGEQLSGYDAKVFEVIVQVNEVDSILRPAMTTSNEIVTDVFENALFVPLEALQSDSLPFVYKQEGSSLIRQEVVIGMTNATEAKLAREAELAFATVALATGVWRDYGAFTALKRTLVAYLAAYFLAGGLGLAARAALAAVREALGKLHSGGGTALFDTSLRALDALAAEHGKRVVIGTTGLDEDQKAVIRHSGDDIGIVFAPNRSVSTKAARPACSRVSRVGRPSGSSPRRV